MNYVRACLLTACLVASAVSVAASVAPAAAADPSDVTRSSYATPVRGDVIEWQVQPGASVQAVNFESGSAVLGVSFRAALVDAVAHGGPQIRAEITGRTDPDGRLALGVARAASLRRALIAAGLPPSRIAIVRDAPRQEADSPRYEDSTVRFVGIASQAVSPRSDQATVVIPALAAVSPIAVATPASPPIPIWEVQPQDITLARTLERWAASAGYKIRWDADRNFLIAASDRYEGSFESAVQALLGSAGIRHSDYPLEACIYANRPPLVRITRLGEQARECEAP